MQNYKQLECEFQDTFETQGSFISAFSICIGSFKNLIVPFPQYSTYFEYLLLLSI